MLSRRRRNLLLLAVLAASVLLALGWSFRPYRVVGESMEPTLLAGDWITLSRRAPERDALVVFKEPDSGRLGVKRVVGLPGERVQILGGDLLLDGRVYQRPVDSVDDLVPLLDERGAAAAEVMHFEGDAIQSLDDRWRLEGAGRAFFARPPDGGYLRRGEHITAERPATDLGLEVEYRLLDPGARLDLILRKGRSVFTLQLAEEGRLLRLTVAEGADGEERELARLATAAGAEGRAFFTLADRGLTVALDGTVVVDHLDYPAPEPLRLSEVPADFPQVEQAGVGGHGPLEVGRIRLGRDLDLRSGGTFGTGVGLQLADGEYFLLGDHPTASRDSRHYGAVPDDAIVGTVAARWWPRGWTLRGWRHD